MMRVSERVAWTVLLGAFGVFCALAIGVPAAGITYVNRATVEPKMLIRLQAGRVVAFGATEAESDARVVGLDGREVSEGTTIIVDNDSQSLASLTVSAEDGEKLALFNLYGGTRLTVSRARLPRYAPSNRGPELAIFVKSGRAQLQNLGARDLNLRVTTDHAEATLRAGTYSLEVISDPNGGETNLTVREGSAQINLSAPVKGQDNVLSLLGNQRVVARKDAPLAVSAPFRNLIRNGDFMRPLEADWQNLSSVEVAGDPLGSVSMLVGGDERSLIFDRRGRALRWGRTGVIQQINQDVKDRRSLQLRLAFSIQYQDIPVCGSQGSECPLIARIVYRDKDGGEREWVQGFYADGIPSPDTLPDYVRTLPLSERQRHIRKTLGSREVFESENLLTTLHDVQFIKSFSLYAEGHGVTSQVYGAELLLD